MSAVSNNPAANPFSSIGLSTPTSSGSAGGQSMSLTSQNFLQLLLAQVQNQSPLNPMDSTAFMGQLAQISTVSGINDLNTQFSSLSNALTSNQALQAANLVGHKALVDAASLSWDGSNPVDGAVSLPSSSGDVKVRITDASGAAVRTIDLGSQPAGTSRFSWDGTDDAGNAVPPGSYDISAIAVDNGQNTALQTLAQAAIQGVSIGNGTLTLDLQGIGSVELSQIQQIS